MTHSPYRRRLPLWLAAGLTLPCMSTALTAQDPPPPKPWRLDDAIGPPSWLKLSGELRERFESLNGQFRSSPALGSTQNDLYQRILLRADVDLDPFGATVEVQDGRGYLLGGNDFADTTTVDTFDVLQANASYDLGEFAGGRHRLTAGRETIDLGSRRLVARNQYRNTINAFDGLDWQWRSEDGDALHAFWTLPVLRRPTSRAELLDNEHEWDNQDQDVQFWGVFGEHRFEKRLTGEAYVLGLDENVPGTSSRNLYTPGFRVLLAPTRDDVFAEFEAAYQFGERGTRDVSAYFAHASVGWVFDCECEPTVRIAWDYASGDKDPTDGDWNRFDTLFGARRFEYGPTGIYGTIARSNLNSPELRFSIKPTKQTWVMVAWRDVRLAEARDAWTTAGAPAVADPTGAAGDAVGQQVECRLRWDALPKSLRIEGGGAYFARGSFLERANNAQPGDTRYAFLEAIWTF